MPALGKKIRPVAATTGQMPQLPNPNNRGYLFIALPTTFVNPSRGQATTAKEVGFDETTTEGGASP